MTDAALADIDLLILDVDGVLTDGRLYYGADGEILKAFHAQDGLGLRLLRNEGISLGVISGRAAPPLVRRCEDLKIEHALLGRDDKARALDELLQATGHDAARTGFVGDDVLDLPAMQKVGVPLSVSSAHQAARDYAVWVSPRGGGEGGVRDIADAILRARGRLEEAVAHLLGADVGQGKTLQ